MNLVERIEVLAEEMAGAGMHWALVHTRGWGTMRVERVDPFEEQYPTSDRIDRNDRIDQRREERCANGKESA